IKSSLALSDVAGGHEEMNVLACRNAELVNKVYFGPADDLAERPIDDGSEEFAGTIVEKPHSVGWRSRGNPHRACTNYVIFESIVGRLRRPIGKQIKRRSRNAQDQACEQPKQTAGIFHGTLPTRSDRFTINRKARCSLGAARL